MEKLGIRNIQNNVNCILLSPSPNIYFGFVKYSFQEDIFPKMLVIMGMNGIE